MKEFVSTCVCVCVCLCDRGRGVEIGGFDTLTHTMSTIESIRAEQL